ncbi:hypothetical protein ACH5RR_006768 [Cinchona calisaya]|uniref:Aminotransferase-like plant mobile domain-containing protein n=1 Tax=Cinchona calisaya TaxID=153742 RepID=A0ABD3AQA1_9GENT
MNYITLAGFAGVMLSGYIQVDHALVTSFVERWRPETHTFHLPVGEATITLQDIEVLWGLCIDGPLVSERDISYKHHEWVGFCQILLGITPTGTDIKGGRIKASCLSVALSEYFLDDAPDEMCRQRARTYILLLLRGLLFPDHSCNMAPLCFMMLLRDLETVWTP